VDLLVAAGRDYIPVDRAVFAPEFKSDEPEFSDMKPFIRPPMDQIIEDITQAIWYKDQIVHRRFVDAKEAQIGARLSSNTHLLKCLSLHLIATLDPPLSENIANAVLNARNIQQLYSHQVAAVNAVRKGKHVVVSTSTASGKSVIYQVSSIPTPSNYFISN